MYNVSGLAFAEKPYSGIVTPTRLYDASRNKNHGTHSNITMVQLPKGLWVRSLNGSSSNISLGSPASLDDLTEFTYSVWVNVASEPTAYSPFIMKWGPTKRLRIFPTRQVNFLVACVGTDAIVNSADNAIVLGTWQNIVGTYKNKVPKVFIDGADVSVTTTNGVGDEVSDAARTLHIGYDQNTARYLDGLTALPIIFNYALSAGQIKNIYEKQLRDWFI